ncbi:hypothetical protein ABID23_000714 [Bartonella silvatica]|uniref:Uncharacterized protein n=1 Tax=Bartonella silvatica TaxID=357760 RepID=A0ABV2HGF3_9HYPH
MLLPYLKKITLFGIISILFTGHISSHSLAADSYLKLCPDGQIPVLRDVRNPSSFVACVDSKEIPPTEELPRDKFRLIATNEKKYNEILERRFKKDRIKSQIIQCFVIGLIIITIMSLPINVLWRFRLKIPAFLFAILTVLSVIAIPFIFDW